MMGYFMLVAAWLTYFALHSFLASTAIKKKFPAKIFRFGYVVLSMAGILGLLFLNGSIRAELFFINKGPVRYISLLLTTVGVMIIQSSFRQYSLPGFVGFTEEPNELKVGGILQYVRHPIYLGILLIGTGFFFFLPTLPTLISCICIFLYLPVGIYLEEKKLIEQFGDAYVQYRKRVPAIIPRLTKPDAA